MNSKLPEDFPSEIRIAFQAGIHKGRRQLSARFEHGGKHYKLVMTGGVYPTPGDVRIVYPQNSPNGHIVFCTLYPPSEDEDEYGDFDDAAYLMACERRDELFYERDEEEY